MDSYRAIESLMYRYAHSFDAGQWESFSGLFEYGELIVDESQGSRPLRGSAAVFEFCSNHVKVYEDGTPKTNHVVSNALIEIDKSELRATSVSYLTVIQQLPVERPGNLSVIFCGRYYDDFENVDGDWHFSRRRVVAISVGELSGHVVK